MIRWCFSLKFLILSMLLSLLAHTKPPEKKKKKHQSLHPQLPSSTRFGWDSDEDHAQDVLIARKNHDASSLSISIWLVNLAFKQSTLHINLNYFPVEFLKEGRLARPLHGEF